MLIGHFPMDILLNSHDPGVVHMKTEVNKSYPCVEFYIEKIDRTLSDILEIPALVEQVFAAQGRFRFSHTVIDG